MTLTQYEVVTILGLIVAIVSAIATIAVVKNVYLKYGLMLVIFGIILILIFRFNYSNDIYKTSTHKPGHDNVYKPKSKKTDKSHASRSYNHINKVDEAMPVAIDCQSNVVKKVESISKGEDYRYKKMYFQNEYLIDLKGCRRERDIIYCEIDFGNNDKEHSIKLYNVSDYPDTWASYIVDYKGNKHIPKKLNFTSAVEKVGWGRDAKYKLKPNNIIGLQFEYRDVHISISKIKQVYIAPEIFNANGVSEGKLIIDISNILIY
jgi:hypothetical protein